MIGEKYLPKFNLHLLLNNELKTTGKPRIEGNILNLISTFSKKSKETS